MAFTDPNLIVNMSVWEDIESLKNFVYRSMHVELIKDREAWFKKIASAHQVLWWVQEGHEPSIKEAKERIEHFNANGSSAHAFSFAKPFPEA